MSYHVSMENYIGQVTRTSFDSMADFERFYGGTMQDGSGDKVCDIYPVIHYQGDDDAECARITHEKAQNFFRNPAAPWIAAFAETRYHSLAKLLREDLTE